MPLHDGNNKILDSLTIAGALNETSGVKLGDVDIIQIRLGGTAIFPDSVGAPVVEGFEASATTLVAGGGDITLTITGVEGATFAISVNAGTLSESSATLTSLGTYVITWTLPANTLAAIETRTATISATGISVLSDELLLDNEEDVEQSGAQAATVTITTTSSDNLGTFFTWSYSGASSPTGTAFITGSGGTPGQGYNIFGDINGTNYSIRTDIADSDSIAISGATGSGEIDSNTSNNSGNIRISYPAQNGFVLAEANIGHSET